MLRLKRAQLSLEVEHLRVLDGHLLLALGRLQLFVELVDTLEV